MFVLGSIKCLFLAGILFSTIAVAADSIQLDSVTKYFFSSYIFHLIFRIWLDGITKRVLSKVCAAQFYTEFHITKYYLH